MLVVQALTNTCHQLAHNDSLALLHGGEVVGHTAGSHAVFLRVRGVVILLGAVQERFGRYATYVQACAAESSLLKQDHILAGFGCEFGCRVSGRTAAYDC